MLATLSPKTCSHPSPALVFKQQGIRRSYMRQCPDCGSKVGENIPPIQAAGKTKGEWDADLWESGKRIRSTQRKHESFFMNREWWDEYERYMRSEEWREKRALVMERAQGLCEGCRRAKAQHVHHLSYDHLGDELLFELVALCRRCHARVHPHRAEEWAA